MLLYLACGALLEIRQDKPVCLGWQGARHPTRAEWETTKAEVERLLGYKIVVWGDLVNYISETFWVEVGDATLNIGYPAPNRFSPNPTERYEREVDL